MHVISHVRDLDLSEARNPSGLKLTLLALASYADQDGTCWPSHATLAKDTHQSVSTIGRHLKEAAGLGLLTVTARRRRDGGQSSNLYRFVGTPLSRGSSGPRSQTGCPERLSPLASDVRTPLPHLVLDELPEEVTEQNSRQDEPLAEWIGVHRRTLEARVARVVPDVDVQDEFLRWAIWHLDEGGPPAEPEDAFLGWCRRSWRRRSGSGRRVAA